MRFQWPWVALVAVLTGAAVLVVVMPQPPPEMRAAAVGLFVAIAGMAPAWVKKLEEKEKPDA
jgi:hypothetical protein